MSETILVSIRPHRLGISGSITLDLLLLALYGSMEKSAELHISVTVYFEEGISVTVHLEEGISVPVRIGFDIFVTADAAWVQVLYFP